MLMQFSPTEKPHGQRCYAAHAFKPAVGDDATAHDDATTTQRRRRNGANLQYANQKAAQRAAAKAAEKAGPRK